MFISLARSISFRLLRTMPLMSQERKLNYVRKLCIEKTRAHAVATRPVLPASPVAEAAPGAQAPGGEAGPPASPGAGAWRVAVDAGDSVRAWEK